MHAGLSAKLSGGAFHLQADMLQGQHGQNDGRMPTCSDDGGDGSDVGTLDANRHTQHEDRSDGGNDEARSYDTRTDHQHHADDNHAHTHMEKGKGGDALLKAVVLSSAGSVFEWMDFSVYAFLAKQIGKAFFPPGSTQTELLQSFSVFAGSFVVRPLGGVIFGQIGDRYGKKLALLLSLFLMAVSTTGMGLLPKYHTIGMWAPALLTILRCLQGIAVGGQIAGVYVFVDGHAPPGRKGYYGGVSLAAAVSGILLGSIVGALMHQFMSVHALTDYGFRIPFLLGSLVGVAGYLLHKHVPELEVPADVPVSQRVTTHTSSSPTSSGVRYVKRSPLVDLLLRHKMEMATAMAVTSLWCSGLYMCFVWLGTYYETLVPHAPIKNGFWINSWWLLVLTIAMPYTGQLADRIGVRKVMLVGALVFFFGSPAVFALFQLGSSYSAFFGQLVLCVGLSFFGGPLPCFLTNHATTSRHHFTAVALIWNVAQAALGGSVTLFATALSHRVRGVGPGVFLSGVAAFSILGMAIGVLESQEGEAWLKARGYHHHYMVICRRESVETLTRGESTGSEGVVVEVYSKPRG